MALLSATRNVPAVDAKGISSVLLVSPTVAFRDVTHSVLGGVLETSRDDSITARSALCPLL